MIRHDKTASGESMTFQVDESDLRWMDRVLQAWRIRKAGAYIRAGDRLLDVGCFDGRLLKTYRSRISRAVGIDPITRPFENKSFQVIRGPFPGSAVFEDDSFDCITMLAVLEHVPNKERVARECLRILSPGGRVVMTVPMAFVDRILGVLMGLRLVGGMSLAEHHQFDPRDTVPTFESAGFRLLIAKRFQLGLNRLFIFEKLQALPDC